MRKILLVVPLVWAVVGCKAPYKDCITLSPAEFTRVTMVRSKEPDPASMGTNTVAEADATAAVVSEKAKLISPGTKLTIFVDEDSSLNQQVIVPAEGFIEFRPIGRVQVDGLTNKELEQILKNGLERDYFQTATVTVSVEQAAVGGVIYLLGSIRQGPMAIPPGENFTLMKVILASGGGGTFSNLGKVRIVRYGLDGKKYCTEVNIDQLMKRAEFEKDIPVKDGDYILVPEKIINF